MLADPTLLVVDDEEVICQGCRRVLSRQGFQVETAHEAETGLTLASERDYDVILLDITMPKMDGVEFLEHLRKSKPDVPVIFITGNPTINNAASAVRLKAADYITKPFKPETIIESVKRHARHRPTTPAEPVTTRTPEVEEPALRSDGMRFWDEAWIQPAEDGELRVGALLGRSVGAAVESVRLPRIGEIVYQGLPMAGLLMGDGTLSSIAAPVSGVVTSVNSGLSEHPGSMMVAARGGDWIATVSPVRLDEEQADCRYRRVVVLNREETSAAQQAQMLGAMGCQTVVANDWNDRLLGPRSANSVVIINAASFGDSGPELVERINAVSPATKVVVVAAGDSKWESAYRRRGIYFYALNPFADGEIVDILDGAFRQTRSKSAKADNTHGLPESISKVCITNRNGTKVCLLVEAGLMKKGCGLGQQFGRALSDRLFPVEMTLGASNITPIRVLKAASAHQQVVVLMARDSGRLPGAVVRHNGDFVHVAGPDAERVTTFVVQPEAGKAGPLKFDERTTAVLADHIVGFMAQA